MRRLFVLLILLLYTMSVSGAAFNFHYCGDKLNRVSLLGIGHKGCCCAKKKSVKKNCCKDEQLVIQSGIKHRKSEIVPAPFPFAKIIKQEFTPVIPAHLSSGHRADFSDVVYVPPARAGGIPRFLVIRTLLI